MKLTGILCYTLLTVTMATYIQANTESNDTDERKLQKKMSRRTTTLVIENPTPGRPHLQPKVIYKRLSHKSYTPPRPSASYKSRRTKYGPPRTLRKPGMKYRGKSPKHSPYPYKKRAAKPRFAPHKKPSSSIYGPPKKTHHRTHNGIGFGEPPVSFNKYRPSKPTEFARPHKPFINTYKEIAPKPDDMDFSSPGSIGDFELLNFSNRPLEDDFISEDLLNSFPQSQGYGEPPANSFAHIDHGKAPLEFNSPVKSADVPVDSYGAPIQPSLHDLTFSTAPSYLDATSPLDEDYNFGPKSRPWNDFKDEHDSSYAHTKKRPAFAKLEETDEVFITPVPEEEKENEELSLNSYSDIYNYRQLQEKKKKRNFYQNVKMLNHPWKGAKLKESSEEVIVGGQYAEPPARYVSKAQRSASKLNQDNAVVFSPTGSFPNHNDQAAPISSYVNYKNSNLAFSPQNLNDVFSIV